VTPAAAAAVAAAAAERVDTSSDVKPYHLAPYGMSQTLLLYIIKSYWSGWKVLPAHIEMMDRTRTL
jgi:hypothetical protein